MVKDGFDPLPDNEKDEWRIRLFVRTGENIGGVRAFDPPVVRVSDGLVRKEGEPLNFSTFPAVRVLNGGISAEEAFELPDADTRALITHGASFHRSDKFFGGLEPDGEVGPGNPIRPRASRITVLASFKNLLETLEYELAVEEAKDYPPDALRDGFDIAGQLFRQVVPGFPLPPNVRRDILQALIAAQKAGESLSTALERLPPGWVLDRIAWDAVTRFAFLEYDFFYAYNDFERVQTALFDNEHEGDAEGCCLVFDRNVINLAAASSEPDSILRAVPHSIITSVHEEFQQADLFKFIPPPIPPANDPDRLPREDLDLNVYVAWASHATYLTKGNHDLVDFQDMSSFAEENIPLPILIGFAPEILIVAILLAMLEHFIDTEDKTSDTGIHTGPPGVTNQDSNFIEPEVLVMPMSAKDHIYKPEHKDLLRLRAFAGKWGAHDDIINKSGPFPAKTGRYFRKLLANL
jgi:hypothetical protein